MKPWTFLIAIFITGNISAGCGRFQAVTAADTPPSAKVKTPTATSLPRTTEVTYTNVPGTVTTGTGTPFTNNPNPGTPVTSPSTSTTTPTNTGGDNVTKLTCSEAQFIRLLNLYRAASGQGALTVSVAGVKSSRWHAQDMIDKNYFSHSEPDGRSFVARAANFGYGAWAENIAAGSYSAEGSFCQWKNSPGHNSNMLSSQHSSMGIGHRSGGGTYNNYWSNNFGGHVSDAIQEPLTTDNGCVIPDSLPRC